MLCTCECCAMRVHVEEMTRPPQQGASVLLELNISPGEELYLHRPHEQLPWRALLHVQTVHRRARNCADVQMSCGAYSVSGTPLKHIDACYKHKHAHACSHLAMARTSGMRSIRRRLMPMVIVAVELGHEPQAPLSFSFTTKPSISMNSTLPPSAIRYGRTCRPGVSTEDALRCLPQLYTFEEKSVAINVHLLVHSVCCAARPVLINT